MTPQFVLDMAYLVMFTAGKISAPFLLTAVVTGVILNILQTITSIRDQSLTFVPKIMVAGVVTGLTLPWILEQMSGFFGQVFALFSQMGA
jgi:flagellar biosynthetic protein FliQ